MILITRPYEDSLSMADIIGKNNCFIEPMMEIEKLDIDLTEYINNHPQAIVKTSKNAGDIYIWPITLTIPEVAQTAEELLEYCTKTLQPDNGKVIYLSGNNVSLDIAAELRELGYDAERIVTYNQIFKKNFSDNLLEDFSKIKTAVFMSAQTLTSFIEVAKNYDSLDFGHIRCVCISKKVAEIAADLNWKNIEVCAQPNQDSIIRRVRNALLDT